MRMMLHRNRLPREGADTPSLKMFKAKFYGASNNLLWWNMSLITAVQDEMIFKCLFQLKPFYDFFEDTFTALNPTYLLVYQPLPVSVCLQ